MRLRIRVQPGARKEGIIGFREGALWVKVSAPPVDGKANERLIEILAEKVSVPKNRIKIVKGVTSKHKEVEIEGLKEDEIFRAFGSGDKIP